MVHDHHHPADPDRQTTVTACVGSIFAQVRHDDRVVAIDADTAFGRLRAGCR
jgi:MinD-like ATPase involved in chromosome partitioning or flagellar assembly